jgi:predicted cupin superfamily sugar epimerase
MPNTEALYWIEHLNLQPHPESGFYKEVFRSVEQVSRAGSGEIRQACTSIYYLLEAADFSGFHRIKSDEIWYFHVLTKDGRHVPMELSDLPSGNLSLVVPAGVWFAAEIPSKTSYTLVSCAVAPGFAFSEFEMAGKAAMLPTYPQHSDLLNQLCR